MIPEGWQHETQVRLWTLSYDGANRPEPLAITAAGAAVAVSDVPMAKPVAGVSVGWLSAGEGAAPGPVINPTAQQMASSRLDLVLAGTQDAVLMIEGFADFLSDEEMLRAVAAGHAAVAAMCAQVATWADGGARARPKKFDTLASPPLGIDAAVDRVAGEGLAEASRLHSKKERYAALDQLRAKAMAALAAPGGGPGGPGALASSSAAASAPASSSSASSASFPLSSPWATLRNSFGRTPSRLTPSIRLGGFGPYRGCRASGFGSSTA